MQTPPAALAHVPCSQPYQAMEQQLQLWPAGLTSPVVYYQLRIRQLEFQIKAVQREGPAAWRAALVAGTRPCALLQRRGLPALFVKLPLTASGVNASESAQFVRTVELHSTRPAKPQPTTAAALASAPRPPLATPPQQQPAKRSRPLSMQPGSAVQQRSEAAHLVARSYASASSVGSVVIQLQPSSCRSSSMSGSSTPSELSSGSRGSPFRWLHRFGASVRSLVSTPMSIST